MPQYGEYQKASAVADMIQGLLRHNTKMNVEKNYVDTHGQSEIELRSSYGTMEPNANCLQEDINACWFAVLYRR